MIKLVLNTRESQTGPAKREITFFNDVKVNLKYDSVASTFSFKFMFDPNNSEHAEVACVSHIHECELYYIHENKRSELLLTGYMLNQGFNHTPIPQLAEVGGYSKAGVIEDSDIPLEMYPLESNGKTFRQIVERLIQPYGIGFIVKSSKNADVPFVDLTENPNASPDQFSITDKVDKVIPKTTAHESKNLKSYLTELANKRNLILSHDVFGHLVVTDEYINKKPILHIDEDLNPPVGFKSMNAIYNFQPVHSHIQVVMQADKDGGNAGEYEFRNPMIHPQAIVRTKVVQLTHGDDITLPEAARNEAGKGLKGLVLTIIMTKPAINNKFITPNNTIMVKSRRLFLYKWTEWFIEDVAFSGDQKEENIVLTCVLPYVYNNALIKNPFIDPHKNLPAL